MLEDVCRIQECSIALCGVRLRGVVPEKDVSPCATFRARFTVVAGVTVHLQLHVRGMEGDGGVRMRCAIIQKLDYFPLGAARRLILFRGQTTECDIKSTVDCPCIVQEFSHNFGRLVWVGGR